MVDSPQKIASKDNFILADGLCILILRPSRKSQMTFEMTLITDLCIHLGNHKGTKTQRGTTLGVSHLSLLGNFIPLAVGQHLFPC